MNNRRIHQLPSLRNAILVVIVSGFVVPLAIGQEPVGKEGEFSQFENDSVVVAVPDIKQSADLWASANATESSNGGANIDPLNKLLPGPSKKNVNSSTASFLDGFDTKTKRSIAKMVGGLAIVVAIFVVFVTLFGKRKNQVARGAGTVLETLSRSMISKSQQMQLVRVGNRLLLIACSEHRVDTLAEIVDPHEIAEIEQMLKQNDLSFFDRTRQRISGGSNSSFTRRQPVYEA